jgi:hypothetical protein
MSTRAAIGFAVKSGWASAVLLVGSAASPSVVNSRNVVLSDPAVPESRQPYHEGFASARQAGSELSRLIAAVERFGLESVEAVVRDYQRGHPVQGAGVVVGSLSDPWRISNDHIRIHALEGQLFRRVVEDAIARCGLPCSTWRQRDLDAVAAVALEQQSALVRDRVTALGRNVTGPWRAEQKSAALAAWFVLAGHS